MRRRPIGQSGMDASVIAFGAWAIGGWTWGGADEKESIRAIHAYLDAGGNLIDTAPIYGFGASEEVVGKAIRDRRDEVILATKCGMRWDLDEKQLERSQKKFSTTRENVDWTGDASGDKFDVHIYNGRDGIRQEIERSLKRLGTDVIDLYQTHWQGDETPIAERMGALEELKQKGKIRAIGVSNATTDQVAEYQAHGRLDSDQEKFSMLDRGLADTNLARCAEDGLALLAYSPLSQGLLTGKIDEHRQFEETDQRRFKERFQASNISRVQEMLAPMRAIAESHQVTLAQLVIAWTLAQRGCSHVLCGARNEQQAQENAAAGQLELSSDELSQIDAAISSYSGV